MSSLETIKQITITIDDRDKELTPFRVYVEAVTDDGIVILCRCESRIVAEDIRRAIELAKGWNVEPNATKFDSIVCRHCLEGLESAGQLMASAEYASCGISRCEQCNGLLVDGEIYRASIEL